MDISPNYRFRSWLRRLGRIFQPGLFALLLVSAACSRSAGLPEDYVIRGKNDWLFVRHETVLEALDPAARNSFGLIEKLNRVLVNNQISLLVVVVPSKMETYAEQLPDDFKISRYMQGFYDSMQSTLRSAGVSVVDLKKPLRHAALQNADSPVFFRLDTHWSPTGAMVAAQAIQEGISNSPSLKKTLDAAPSAKYKLEWASKKQRTRFRDITTYLPAGSPSYPPDEVLRFHVTKENATRLSLLGEMSGGDIALVGSSFSGDSTGFSDALRYALQRDIVNFSINADVGPWVVMRSYLLSDAFQTKPPKLVIWEIPERVVALGPNYQFRPERYKIDDRDWLLQVAALGQRVCENTAIKPKLEPNRLQGGAGTRAGTSTTDADFVEISFDKPVDQLSYLSARIVTDGSKQISIESHGPGVLVKKFTVDAAGDELAHTLRTPLEVRGKGVNRIRIYPGITKTFALTNVEVCRYPEDWLK